MAQYTNASIQRATRARVAAGSNHFSTSPGVRHPRADINHEPRNTMRFKRRQTRTTWIVRQLYRCTWHSKLDARTAPGKIEKNWPTKLSSSPLSLIRYLEFNNAYKAGSAEKLRYDLHGKPSMMFTKANLGQASASEFTNAIF